MITTQFVLAILFLLLIFIPFDPSNQLTKDLTLGTALLTGLAQSILNIINFGMS